MSDFITNANPAYNITTAQHELFLLIIAQINDLGNTQEIPAAQKQILKDLFLAVADADKQQNTAAPESLRAFNGFSHFRTNFRQVLPANTDQKFINTIIRALNNLPNPSKEELTLSREQKAARTTLRLNQGILGMLHALSSADTARSKVHPITNQLLATRKGSSYESAKFLLEGSNLGLSFLKTLEEKLPLLEAAYAKLGKDTVFDKELIMKNFLIIQEAIKISLINTIHTKLNPITLTPEDLADIEAEDPPFVPKSSKEWAIVAIRAAEKKDTKTFNEAVAALLDRQEIADPLAKARISFAAKADVLETLLHESAETAEQLKDFLPSESQNASAESKLANVVSFITTVSNSVRHTAHTSNIIKAMAVENSAAYGADSDKLSRFSALKQRQVETKPHDRQNRSCDSLIALLSQPAVNCPLTKHLDFVFLAAHSEASGHTASLTNRSSQTAQAHLRPLLGSLNMVRKVTGMDDGAIKDVFTNRLNGSLPKGLTHEVVLQRLDQLLEISANGKTASTFAAI